MFMVILAVAIYKETKILIVFDDIIADIDTNKKFQSVV